MKNDNSYICKVLKNVFNGHFYFEESKWYTLDCCYYSSVPVEAFTSLNSSTYVSYAACRPILGITWNNDDPVRLSSYYRLLNPDYDHVWHSSMAPIHTADSHINLYLSKGPSHSIHSQTQHVLPYSICTGCSLISVTFNTVLIIKTHT